uniref:PLEKHM2 PH domain-containing protein n=1 Tax=Parascaris univalens TaxID=6257 RepID=A0A915BBZ9_PARUN
MLRGIVQQADKFTQVQVPSDTPCDVPVAEMRAAVTLADNEPPQSPHSKEFSRYFEEASQFTAEGSSWQETPLSTTVEGQPPVVEQAPNPFDVALKMSLSKAKSLAAARKSEARPSSPVETPPVEFTPFGEVLLDMGEVVGLSIKVFRDEMEKFLKFYQVYVHFGTGQPEHRFLVLSNRAVYLLSLQCNLVSARKTYIICAYLALRDIDYIAVGADYEVLYLHAVKGVSLEAADGTKLDVSVLEVCTACTQLGQAIVDSVSNAYKQCYASSDQGRASLDIYTDCTPQRLILTKFVAKELHQFKDLDDEAVACIALVSSGAILIAQEGLNCAVDGFMRLLTRLDLEQIESAVKQVRNEEGGSSRLTAILNSMPLSGDRFYFSDAHSDDAFEL